MLTVDCKMQIVLCIFSLFAIFYLASGSGECWSLLWPSSLSCEQKDPHGPLIQEPGTKWKCSCKSNCFPVTMTCKRISPSENRWVVEDNRCSHISSLPFALGEADYPGLSASSGSSHGNKVKFACKKGLELRGASLAFCEKGDLHFADPGDVFPTCAAPFNNVNEGSGSESRQDDEDDFW